MLGKDLLFTRTDPVSSVIGSKCFILVYPFMSLSFITPWKGRPGMLVSEVKSSLNIASKDIYLFLAPGT